jgi:hypothetical protein
MAVRTRTIVWASSIAILLLSIGFLGNQVFREGRQGPAGTVASGDEPSGAAFRTLTLYFGDPASGVLAAERRDIIPGADTAEDVAAAVDDLILGPTGDLIPTLPPDARVRHVFVGPGGIVYLDFNGDLLTGLSGGGLSRELLALRSLARTLKSNFDGLERLQILVEGRVIPTLAGHLDVGSPLRLSEWD